MSESSDECAADEIMEMLKDKVDELALTETALTDKADLLLDEMMNDWKTEKEEEVHEEKEKTVEEAARGEGQGVGGPKQGIGGPAVCVCPECKATVKHKPGVPCTSVKCPKCGAKMVGKVEKAEKHPEGLPFAGYPNFNACVRSVMAKKKWPKKRASAYCAVIKRKVEKAEKLFDREEIQDILEDTVSKSKELFVFPTAIKQELKQKKFKMPFEFGFIALKEGKFNDVYYTKKELKSATPTLIGKPLTINHGKNVQDIVGKIIEATWNEEAEHIEGRAQIMEPFEDIAKQVHNGLIKGVSVEVFVEYDQTEDHGLTAKDAEFSALSLVREPACKTPECGIQLD